MTSVKQIEANRQNAKNSTGPKTTHGKAIACQNSLKHGLTTRLNIINSESQTDFDLHRQNFLTELAPQGPTESLLADRIITLSWRLKRIENIQNQTIDALNSPDNQSPLAKLKRSLLPNTQPHIENTNSPDLTLGRMAVNDFTNTGVLEKLLMYERRIESSLYKTLLELQRLNLLRNMNQ